MRGVSLRSSLMGAATRIGEALVGVLMAAAITALGCGSGAKPSHDGGNQPDTGSQFDVADAVDVTGATDGADVREAAVPSLQVNWGACPDGFVSECAQVSVPL